MPKPIELLVDIAMIIFLVFWIDLCAWLNQGVGMVFFFGGSAGESVREVIDAMSRFVWMVVVGS